MKAKLLPREERTLFDHWTRALLEFALVRFVECLAEIHTVAAP
jgi:hypothetical protein